MSRSAMLDELRRSTRYIGIFANITSDDIRAARNTVPMLNMHHVNGPVLFFRDGQVHWLTTFERLRMCLGWDDAYSLERKLRPELSWAD